MPPSSRLERWKRFAVALVTEYDRDNIGDVAGSVTFFAVLALFPFLVFVISLSGLFIDLNDVQGLIDQMARIAPGPLTDLVSQQIGTVLHGKRPGVVTLGALGALWAASGAIVSLMNALNTVNRVKEQRSWFRQRLVGLIATLSAVVLSILAVTLALSGPLLRRSLGDPVGPVLSYMRWPLAGFLMMFLLASLYYFLPNLKHRFRFFTPGAVVGVFLWLLASVIFSVYVAHFGNYDSTYGTLGGGIILLLWMWITTQVILIGAEINVILERGPDKKPLTPPADDVAPSPGTDLHARGSHA